MIKISKDFQVLGMKRLRSEGEKLFGLQKNLSFEWLHLPDVMKAFKKFNFVEGNNDQKWKEYPFLCLLPVLHYGCLTNQNIENIKVIMENKKYDLIPKSIHDEFFKSDENINVSIEKKVLMLIKRFLKRNGLNFS